MANHPFHTQSSTTGFYSISDQSSSNPSITYKRNRDIINLSGVVNNEVHDEQPSFSASTSSLPGALGIEKNISPISSGTSESDSVNTIRSSAVNRHMKGNNSYSYDKKVIQDDQNDQQQYRRQYIPGVNGYNKPSSKSSNGGRYAVTNDSTDSNTFDRSRSDSLSSNGSANTNANSSNSNLNNGNMRNFLVPIGATGARQKLSILSASQRPRTAQSPATPSFGSASFSKQSINPSNTPPRPDPTRIRPTTSEGRSDPRSTFQRVDSDASDVRRYSNSHRSVAESTKSNASSKDDPDEDSVIARNTASRKKASFDKASRIMGTSGFAAMVNPPSTTRTRRNLSGQGGHDLTNSTSSGSGVYSNSGAHNSSGSVSSLGGGSSNSHSKKASKSSFYKQKSGSQSSFRSSSSLREAAQAVFGGGGGSNNSNKDQDFEKNTQERSFSQSTSASGNSGGRKFSNSSSREGFFSGLSKSSSSGTIGDGQNGQRPRSSSGTKDIAGQVKLGFRNMFSRSNKSSRPSTGINSISSPQPIPTHPSQSSGAHTTVGSPSSSPLSHQVWKADRILDRTDSAQHSRASSNASGRIPVDQNSAHVNHRAYYGSVGGQEIDNQTVDPARQVSNNVSRNASVTSNGTSNTSRMRSNDEFDGRTDIDGSSTGKGKLLIVGRRPSKEYASAYGSSASRPQTAPSVRSIESFRNNSTSTISIDENNGGDNERSKTPVPSVVTGAVSGHRTPTPRRPSNASEWSFNTTATSTPREVETNSNNATHPLNESNMAEHTLRNSRDPVHVNTRRLESLGYATSNGTALSSHDKSPESTYSAPNSSRNLSPTLSDRPSVPLTSPLLASVLGQQNIQPITIPNAPIQYQQQQLQQSPQQQLQQQQQGRSIDRINVGSFYSPSLANDESVQAITPSTSSYTVVSTPSPSKPMLPAKSRNRIASMQTMDDSGLTSIEDSNSIISPMTPSDSANSKIQNDGRPESSQTNLSNELEATARRKEEEDSNVKAKSSQIDPSTFVPADALLRTRRGIPVRKAAAAKDEGKEKESTETEKVGKLDVPTESETFHSPLSSLQLSNSPLIHENYAWTNAENGGNAAIRSETDGVVIAPEGQTISFNSGDYDPFDDDQNLVDAISLLPTSAWNEVDSSLLRFKAIPAQSTNDKGQLLRAILLPFLALEAETPDTRVSGSGPFQSAKARRKLFFDWIRQLLLELQVSQTSADRGAILESIACIIESRNLSTNILEKDEEDQQTFFGILGHILSYAIGELNKKGVYQNTLIFSGRLLAVAFFRIEGVASKLLRALPVNRFALERVANEAQWQDRQPEDWDTFKSQFPPWLHDFCFEDARSYLKMLDSQSGQTEEDDRFLVRQESVEVEMSGNWLRRWQSDDSELFFSFCRSYHRQLSGTFSIQAQKNSNNALLVDSDRNNFFGGPGFAHLATCIHQKCLSLVHRDILSVTTLSSQKNFNPGETANVLSGSTAGKPRHLEAANRRCTAIVVDIVRTASTTTTRTSIFATMLGIHVKCLVKRTSLYDVQGVFCLLDWLDGVLSHMEHAEMIVSDFIDIDFLLQTMWLLLKDADHALALMRTIAFCYSNFAILTDTRQHRERFFEEILLHPVIFKKLFLSWSFTIRAYFLHLLVFRLARINDFSNPEDDPKGKTSIRVIKLFNKRLDEIRKRHDELSPPLSSTDSQSDDDTDDYEKFKKGRPQSFVSTIKYTPSVHKVDVSPAMTKAERVLGIGLPDPVLSNKGESKAQSRAARWLRVLGGKSSGKGSKGSTSATASDVGGKGFNNEVPKIFNKPRNTLPRLDEIDIFSDEGETEAEVNQSNVEEEEDDDNATPRAEGGSEFHFEPKDGFETGGKQSTSNPSTDVTDTNDGNSPPGNEHINAEMSFDLQNMQNSVQGIGGLTADGNLANDPSQQRISKAFSRRRSLLPGPAYSLVHGDGDSESEGGEMTEHGGDDEVDERKSSLEDGTIGSQSRPTSRLIEEKHFHISSIPYDRTLHIYAVQSLREYEQTVQEHDDFFNTQEDPNSPQVPRLPIQWPAMWSE